MNGVTISGRVLQCNASEDDEYSIPDELNLPEEFADANIPEFSDDALQELVDFAGDGTNQQQFDMLQPLGTDVCRG